MLTTGILPNAADGTTACLREALRGMDAAA
jgi:hypothetical protein